ncbi:hypothetical protein EPA93_29025 [Ktedonosporobacter rubrisoli]|uniref:XRE family transcriptional regulator n=1 Tax=Ktedonosporobacter rubrisoli TaxID=2509675 RepID=A0A4P6JWG5_KTERU|nr:hypothetical protein [Ktedonosporobacter rubrisoli]QBD79805.1 hypothetical protein EPA93_29025 [Ktedonosporobacter rubrisoli]
MNRRTFYQIFQWQHVSLLMLARESNRHPYLIWDMLLGHPMRKLDAVIILATFNEMASTHYELGALSIIYQENEAQHG